MEATLAQWEAAMTQIAEVNAELDNWDNPPSLMMAYLEDEEIRFGLLEMPPEYWAEAPPASILRFLASSFETFAPRPPENFAGVVLISEAWGISNKMVPTEESEDYLRSVQEFMKDHHLAEHPDAQEIRVICAVDESGHQYDLHQTRGETKLVFSSSHRDNSTGGGAIPDALLDLISAILKREVEAQWSEWKPPSVD